MTVQTVSHTNNKDVVIAKLTVLSDKKLIKSVTNMVSHVANICGISIDDSIKLQLVLKEIVETVIDYSFEGKNSENIDIIVSKRFNSLLISVEDKGLPFQFENTEDGDNTRFQTFMAQGYADRVYYKNLGPEGNRVVISKSLPASDVRELFDISEHRSYLDKKAADPQEEISIKMLEVEDVKELVKVVYRSYGHTYPNEFMYFPERIESRIKSGLMKSCVANNSKGEIVGHLSLTFESADARVCEGGIAIVDTRYRGLGIFKKMRKYLQNYAEDNGIIGIYGEAVTIHPYTQLGVAKLGAKEVGFLLGYVPEKVVINAIDAVTENRRQSIALMYTPVIYDDVQEIYLPEIYHDIASEIYKRLEFKRHLKKSGLSIAEADENIGKSNVVIRKDYGQAFFIIDQYGRNTLFEIKYLLNQMCTLKIDCIYVDLPLFQELSYYIIPKLRESGFFIGGIIPQLRNGDILRMQYLNNVQIAKKDIKVASDFGKYILDRVYEDKDEIEFNTLKT